MRNLCYRSHSASLREGKVQGASHTSGEVSVISASGTQSGPSVPDCLHRCVQRRRCFSKDAGPGRSSSPVPRMRTWMARGAFPGSQRPEQSRQNMKLSGPRSLPFRLIPPGTETASLAVGSGVNLETFSPILKSPASSGDESCGGSGRCRGVGRSHVGASRRRDIFFFFFFCRCAGEPRSPAGRVGAESVYWGLDHDPRPLVMETLEPDHAAGVWGRGKRVADITGAASFPVITIASRR